MFKLINKNSKYNFLGMKKIALLFSFIVIGHYQIIQLKNKISYMSSSISDSEYRISDLYGRVSDVEEDLKSSLHKHY